jgi:alkaline phosphatase
MSFEAFTDKVDEMRETGADFDTALAAIKDAFGLTTEAEQTLTLTEDELMKLQAAYELSMLPSGERVLGDAEALLYGGYDPLTMACSHILNNKAGVDFTSYSHTGLQIPVYAQGVGAAIFSGAYDNTDIFAKTMTAMGLSID